MSKTYRITVELEIAIAEDSISEFPESFDEWEGALGSFIDYAQANSLDEDGWRLETIDVRRLAVDGFVETKFTPGRKVYSI